MNRNDVEKIERIDYPYLCIGEKSHTGTNKMPTDDDLEKMTY